MTDNGETLIHKKDIERLFSSEARRKLDAFHTPRQILVACDPNTSSEDGSSEMSLVSIVCIENQVWVRVFARVPFPPPPFFSCGCCCAGK